MVVLWPSDQPNMQIKIMKKILIQGAISIALFFVIWLGLSSIDWLKLFKVQKVTDKTEEKLGDLFWEVFQKSEKEVKKPYVSNTVDSIITVICNANQIERALIHVHVLSKDDINAFALPNNHLIIYSGLILNSENQEEFAGVVAHELAHIQLKHVIKKLIKEVGLSVLISMTSGNAEIIKETAKMLSSSAFDRGLEKEADLQAVEYLLNSNINPKPFANFLYKLSEKENETLQYLTWINTHPDSKDRAAYIIEYSTHKKSNFKTILSINTWSKLKEKLQE
jgi:predicted Zn-dependent protease